MLTLPEMMTLLRLASRTCLLAEANGEFGDEIERQQFIALAKDARPILRKVDRENPGFLAIPFDGLCWKDRWFDTVETLHGPEDAHD